MARRTYTEQERREVLVDVPTLGVEAAAWKHRVPPTRVRSWIDRGRGTPSKAAESATTVRRAPTPEVAVAEKQTRRTYSDEEKRAVVADAAMLGVCGAAKKHGISESNVSRWRTRYATSEASGEVRRARPSITKPMRTKPPTKPSPTRRVAKTYTPSQKAEAVEYAAAHGVSAASAALGISRYSIYQWQRQVAKAAAGEGASPTTGRLRRTSRRSATHWPELEAQLREAPGLEAKTLLEALMTRYPGQYSEGQLRTLQRRVRQWRASEGPERDVKLAQRHRPDEAAQSDFTHASELGVRRLRPAWGECKFFRVRAAVS